MYEIIQKPFNVSKNSTRSEINLMDPTVLCRLQSLEFELQMILININKVCINMYSKKAAYLEAFVNYIGEIFNQSILFNEKAMKNNRKRNIYLDEMQN